MSEVFKPEDIIALPSRVLIHCDKSQEVKIQLESALKLQKLVKELATNDKMFQSLVEESEK